MGIQYDSDLFYGIEFSYDQVKHIKDFQNVKELGEAIGCTDLSNLWSELGYHLVCDAGYNRNEKDYLYIIGEKISKDLTLDAFNKVARNTKVLNAIKKGCKDMQLEWEEPKIFSRPNIS